MSGFECFPVPLSNFVKLPVRSMWNMDTARSNGPGFCDFRVWSAYESTLNAVPGAGAFKRRAPPHGISKWEPRPWNPHNLASAIIVQLTPNPKPLNQNGHGQVKKGTTPPPFPERRNEDNTARYRLLGILRGRRNCQSFQLAAAWRRCQPQAGLRPVY